MALEPWSDFVPVQPPEAVQDVVFVETHVRVVDCPWVRVVVLAEKESVGVVEGGGVGRRRFRHRYRDLFGDGVAFSTGAKKGVGGGLGGREYNRATRGFGA